MNEEVNKLIDDCSIINTKFISSYIPDRDLGELFIAVQTAKIFKDSKTFVDCSANKDPALILIDYEKEKNIDGFSLEVFIHANFSLPPIIEAKQLDHNKDMFSHLRSLWGYLTMSANTKNKYSSLINLPYPFVVPGGRFREMFYWDSYFTIIGLLESDNDELALGMIRNMAFLVTTFGHIPNGNRTYFLSRSQPPFFAEIINCYANKHGMENALEFLPALELEYKFWTKDDNNASGKNKAVGKSVRLENNMVLNRYTGTLDTPRMEAYDKEYDWAQVLPKESRPAFHRNLRAACESGWDFSSRWFADGINKTTVNCEDLIPICLNTLLHNCELQLAKLFKYKNDGLKQTLYEKLATTRKAAITKYCWFEKSGVFNDYNYITQSQNSVISIATVYPLFFKVASQEQADKVAALIEEKFLKKGGVVTTQVNTGEQWDSPNGWAPMQWLTVIGLSNYGYTNLAITITERWLATNKRVFKSEHKMTEKYNVVDPNFPGGGGNYENQDGFGWTNGVALALNSFLNHKGRRGI